MTRPVRRYACGACNREFKTGEERLHSDWSGLSYCTDIDACRRRARRWADRPPIQWKKQTISVAPSRRR